MTEQKSVVVSVSIPSRVTSVYHFEYFGDVTDEDEMKSAAWEALHSDFTLDTIEIVESEYVDNSQTQETMECNPVDGAPDDFRERPTILSKAKLWRRVASLYGRLLLTYGPNEVGGSLEFADAPTMARQMVQLLDGIVGSRREDSLAKRLKAALAAWEAAE